MSISVQSESGTADGLGRCRFSRWLGLARLLLLPGLLLTASCGRKADSARTSGRKEIAAPAGSAAESEQSVFAARLQAALAKAPEFEREGALRQIVKTRFRVDWNQLFPDGFHQDKLLGEKEVEALVQHEFAAAADRKFTPERRREVEAQAALAFPLIKEGDEMTVLLVNQRRVSGQVVKIDPPNIKIGTYTLLLRDIVSHHASAFNPTENAGLRRVYINQQFAIPREDYLTANAKAIRDDVYHRCGYLLQAGKWVRIDTLLVTEIEPELDRMAADFRRQQEFQIRFTVREQMRQDGYPEEKIPAAPAATP